MLARWASWENQGLHPSPRVEARGAIAGAVEQTTQTCANPSTTRRSSPDCSMPGLQGTVQDRTPGSTANLLQSVMPSA